MKFATAFSIATLILAQFSSAQSIPLVPKPATIAIQDGQCKLPREIFVSAPYSGGLMNVENLNWGRHLRIVKMAIEAMTAGEFRFLPDAFPLDEKEFLKISLSKDLDAEEYSLQINKNSIQIEVASFKGLTHATATLLQLIGSHSDGNLPLVTITDKPSVNYRNFMIDMGRNPHSLELLKETIDLLWFYKVDSVQLHLTDDQRFAFPSTAFPKLWDGLISLEEFKELEAYAAARGVTIIPELEVPGHSSLLRTRYPDVFGKTEAELATSQTALAGIKTLLDEMLAVFSSSPYVHVGGDEASGVPEDDQRNLINELHRYLKSKGKQTLVWEGPRAGKGDNKVNTEVIHLNWRTINYPADQMLNDGYRVVNAAWDPLYLVDHYPRTNFTMTSPQHIYETLKLTRFKHVNPGIPTFAEPLVVKPNNRLLGFCMPWWEGREENYFDQIVPRLIPFADVAWNSTGARDYESFRENARRTEATRKAAFYPVSIAANSLAIETDGVFHSQTAIELSKSRPTGVVRYTTDGSQPNPKSPKWKPPVSISKTTTFRAAMFDEDTQIGHGSRRTFTKIEPVENLALGKPVRSSVSSGSPFSVERITDGGVGNLDFYLGYPAEPKPIEITIDLENAQPVSRIVVVAYTISNSFEKYSVEVSADGSTFEEVASRLERPDKATEATEHKFPPRKTRFVRIKSHGNKGYVFDSFSKLVEVQVFK